jgi:hypothetical protein
LELFFLIGDGLDRCVRSRRAASGGARVRRRGEKPGFRHPILAVGFEVGVLLALDFNRD